jgi:subtilisin family serine protease
MIDRLVPKNWTGCLWRFIVICGVTLAGIHDSAFAQGNPPPFREGRLLAMPRPGADLTPLHAAKKTKPMRKFPEIGNLELVELPAGATVAEMLDAFQESGLVLYAEPDYLVRALTDPNDFRYTDGTLDNLHNTGLYGGTPGADIHAREGWDFQTSASNIIVAVLDTGVRASHEDFAGNLWINPGETGPGPGGIDKSINGLDDDGDGYIDDVYGINVLLGTGNPVDDYGHGTHVSGILGARGNNSVGVVGVAWRVQMMACKILDSAGNGSVADAITGMEYARSKGARIINASWGGPSYNSAALHDAIGALRSAGIIFVAACGNDNADNDTSPLFPASYEWDNIVSVAATDRNDLKAQFSSYGATTVDLGAPGAPVYSSWNGSDTDYRYFQGTSMAAPHVSGACALLMARYPGDTYRQTINRLLAATDPLPALAGKCVTGGRLNLYKALAGSAVTNPPAASPAFFTYTNSLLLGGANLDDARAVASAGDGSLYIAGSFSTTFPAPSGTLNSAGSRDGYLARINPNGTVAWALRFGGVGLDQAEAIAVEGGNLYVGGFFQGMAGFPGTNLIALGASDAFLASFQTNGTFQWVRKITGAGDEIIQALAVNPVGGVKAVGSATQGAVWDSLASSGNGMFVLTVNAAGQLTTAQTAASTLDIKPGHVMVTGNGLTVVAGKFTGTAFGRASAGDYDTFLAAFPATGNYQWAFTGGGAGADEAGGLALASDGTVVLGTYFFTAATYNGRTYNSGKGTWLGQFSTAGTVISSNFIDGASVSALAAGAKGIVHVVGSFSQSFFLNGVPLTANGTTALIASYLVPNWELEGVSTLYSGQSAVILKAAATADDGLVLVGAGSQSLVVDGRNGATSSASIPNALICRLTPPYCHLTYTQEGINLRLKYPSYYYDAVLQSNAALPGNWVNASGTLVKEPGQRTWITPVGPQNAFFRLRR